MSRHTRVAVLTAALLLATACTNGSDDKPDTTTTPASKPGLSATWAPKLQTAAAADTGICNQAGDQACATHLTDIALAVGDLETAITDAGSTAAYPKTMAEIGTINKAVQAYTDHECLGDANASIAGSPCPDDAQAITGGVKAIMLAMDADEANAG